MKSPEGHCIKEGKLFQKIKKEMRKDYGRKESTY